MSPVRSDPTLVGWAAFLEPRPPVRRSAAAESRIQVADARRARTPGNAAGSRGPSRIRATTPALPSPAAIARTWPAAPRIAGLSVTRSTWGSMWVGAGMASPTRSLVSAALPGKTDRRCPSPPIPTRTRSNAGQPSSEGSAVATSVAYAAAHHCGPSPAAIARSVGNGWTWPSGIGIPPGARSASSARNTFDSGSEGETKRSSPHHRWTRSQGTPSDSAGSSRQRYIARGVDPPVSATSARPRAATAARTRSTRRTAQAWARALGSALTRSWGSPARGASSGSWGRTGRPPRGPS